VPGSSSWMPYAPQGVKGFDDDNDNDCLLYLPYFTVCLSAHITTGERLIPK